MYKPLLPFTRARSGLMVAYRLFFLRLFEFHFQHFSLAIGILKLKFKKIFSLFVFIKAGYFPGNGFANKRGSSL